MCFGAKDETAEGKLVTREMRTSSPSGTVVTFSLRLASGPRAMWECIPSCGGCQSLASALIACCASGCPVVAFLFPPVKNFRCLVAG